MRTGNTLHSDNSISQFLHYGYALPDGIKLPPFIDEMALIEKTKEADKVPNITALIEEGTRRLDNSIAYTLRAARDAAVHVVPLSGGLDSRAILGGLLEHLDASRIHTLSFGVPGTWDFEIGSAVAEQACVAHTRIDLSKVSWDTDTLIQFAAQCEHPIPLFEAALFHQTRSLFKEQCVYWSGYMGDPITGAHLPPRPSKTWEQAKLWFSARNQFVRSLTLSLPGLDVTEGLPRSPLGDSCLCYDDQLDFGIRQQHYIKSVVLLHGYTYCTPYLCPEWLNFIVGVPRRFRIKQSLYKKILMTAHPHLFSLPVKNNFGLPLNTPRWRRLLRRGGLCIKAAARRYVPGVNWPVSPGLNYIDFDRDLRQRKDLQTVVYENIQDLKQRGIVDWVDIDALWRRHQNRQKNHADALTLLASLEINLKAQELRPK
jgi:asparagine synthetase B (glutamine-hydrolysing)